MLVLLTPLHCSPPPRCCLQIMTWRQYSEAAVNYAGRRLLAADWPEYRPDFVKCADHFAIHAGAGCERLCRARVPACEHDCAAEC